MFEWKTEYSCQIAEIDKQHKRLFELASDLYDIATLDDDYDHYDEIMGIFQELSDYTVYHFQYEEKLLDEYGYDPLKVKLHKLEHGSFVKKVTKIMQEDLDKNEQQLLKDTITFIGGWVAQHILETDKNYSEFLNQKGIR